jgi:hypothetical protein
MDSQFQQIITRLRKRIQENRPGVVSKVDPMLTATAFADASDVIELINLLDKRFTLIEEQLSNQRD